MLVPSGVATLKVLARWGDYVPVEKDGRPAGEWKRTERGVSLPVSVGVEQSGPVSKPLADSDGLEIVTSVRRVRGLDDLPGLPPGSRAVSIFLVNRRSPEEESLLRDRRFAFQACLTVESDESFVPRPNPRGRQGRDDPDERIADLQYRDVMEFAVGHGVSTMISVVEGACRRVRTTQVPMAEVERVEPADIRDVELGMEVLATLETGPKVREAVGSIVTQYRAWITVQRKKAPREGPQREVSDELLNRAALAAGGIEAGVALLDDPQLLEAFRLTNRAMAMAARQRRAQERGVNPANVEPPMWRPFQSGRCQVTAAGACLSGPAVRCAKKLDGESHRPGGLHAVRELWHDDAGPVRIEVNLDAQRIDAVAKRALEDGNPGPDASRGYVLRAEARGDGTLREHRRVLVRDDALR